MTTPDPYADPYAAPYAAPATAPYADPYGSAQAWPTAPAGPPPGDPVRLPYHQLLVSGRWGRHGWWRVLVGVPFALVVWFVPQALAVVVWTVGLAVQGVSADRIADLPTTEVTPGFLAAVNVGLGLGIPGMMLVVFVMHRLGPGWVSSVVGRLRWRYLLACVGLSVLALVVNLVVSAFLPASSDPAAGSTTLNEFTTRTAYFLLVIALLTPFQAAGEEYVFRGYLTQAFGSIFAWASPRVAQAVAVVVPALLFALAHGLTQGLPVFTDRFVFGLVAGVLVIATGGLEAGIALHVLNNFLAYGFALAFGDMTEALNASGGSWWSLVSTLVQAVLYTSLCVLVARRMGLQTRTGPVVLIGVQPRV